MKKTVLAALLVTAAVLTTACGSGSAASGNVSSNEAVTTIQAQHPEEAAQAATEEPAAVEAATEETAAQAATEAPAAASFPEFEPRVTRRSQPAISLLWSTRKSSLIPMIC